jgi:drug/metabolite transporter (DMT)-like permease
VNLILLLLLGTIWGASYLFIKVTVAEVPTFTLVAGRVGLAAIVMWLIVAARSLSPSRRWQDWFSYAVLGFFNMAVPYSLISWSEQFIPSGIAALLQSTTPIFTVLLAHFLTDDERFSPARVAGVALGFFGVGLLMLPSLRQGLSSSLLAQLAMVLSSLCYGAMAIFARRRILGQNPIVSSASTLTMATLFILPVSLLIDRPFDIAPSLPAMASWASLSLLGTVAAVIIYYELINRAGATFTTMVTYIIPVNGLILGAIVLNEAFTPMVIASLALVLAGVFLVNQRPRQVTPSEIGASAE